MAQSGDVTTLERARTQRAALKSASALAFAPNGVLLVGDSLGGAVWAFETGDTTPAGAGPVHVEDLTGKIAALGRPPTRSACPTLRSIPPPATSTLPSRAARGPTPKR